MDFGYFLVIAYIHGGGGGCALAMPTSKSRAIAEKIKGCPSLWSRVALELLGLPLVST